MSNDYRDFQSCVIFLAGSRQRRRPDGLTTRKFFGTRKVFLIDVIRKVDGDDVTTEFRRAAFARRDGLPKEPNT